MEMRSGLEKMVLICMSRPSVVTNRKRCCMSCERREA